MEVYPVGHAVISNKEQSSGFSGVLENLFLERTYE